MRINDPGSNTLNDMDSSENLSPHETLKIGDFACLEVAAIENVGAFLDWGLPKDLFLPFAEQTYPIRVGDKVIVYIYVDNTDRIAASMKLDRNLNKTPAPYEAGQNVKIMIADRTDLGYKAIIEGKHWGLLHKNDVFKNLYYGDELTAMIKHIREDGKIDLSFLKTGHQAGDDIAPKILEMLKDKGGFLEITDKTPPETIYNLFGVSKKKYKIALGGLYKKRLIQVEDAGIRLLEVKAGDSSTP